MKHINKKFARKWHKVKYTRICYDQNGDGPFLWCMKLESNGRFCYTKDCFFCFEKEEDAAMFALKWL